MPKPSKTLTATATDQRRNVVLILQILVLLIIIGVYLGLTAQSYVIECEKDGTGMNVCTLRTTVLGVVTLQQRSMTGLTAAVVEDQCEGNNCKYNLVLYDSLGNPYPVEEQYTPDEIVKGKVAKLLNEFVSTPEKLSITLREQVNWLSLMLPVTFIGAFIIYRLSLNKPKK